MQAETPILDNCSEMCLCGGAWGNKLTTNIITVLSSGRSFRREGKEMERDTRGGRPGGWEGKRSLCRKRSFLDRCLHCIIVYFHGGSCWRTLYNVALSTIRPCCGSSLFTEFVFSFVIFMKLDSVICSLGLEWGQWNDRTQLSLLSCKHNSLGHVLAPCTITHTSHLHEFTVPSCREHNATFRIALKHKHSQTRSH